MDESALTRAKEVVKQALNSDKSVADVKDFMRRDGFSESDINLIFDSLEAEISEAEPITENDFDPNSPWVRSREYSAPYPEDTPKKGSKKKIAAGVIVVLLILSAILYYFGFLDELIDKVISFIPK